MEGFAPVLVCCGACLEARRRLDDLALGGRNPIPAAREKLVGHVDSLPRGSVLGAVERFVDVYSGEVAWRWAPIHEYRGHGDPTRPAQARHRPGPPYTMLEEPWRAEYRNPDGQIRSRSFTRKVDAERWLRGEVGSMAVRDGLVAQTPARFVLMRCRGDRQVTYRLPPLKLRRLAERCLERADRAREAGEVAEPWFHVGSQWAG